MNQEQSGAGSSIVFIMGRETYEAMLCEHFETGKKLKERIASVSASLPAERKAQKTEIDIIDKTWDVVSDVLLNSTRAVE